MSRAISRSRFIVTLSASSSDRRRRKPTAAANSNFISRFTPDKINITSAERSNTRREGVSLRGKAQKNSLATWRGERQRGGYMSDYQWTKIQKPLYYALASV